MQFRQAVHSHGTSPIAWVHCKFRACPDRRPERVGFGLVPELNSDHIQRSRRDNVVNVNSGCVTETNASEA